MKLNKIKELNCQNSDIFFILDLGNDKILINNDYEGLLLLDYNLNILKKIHSPHESIDSCFKNKNGSQIIIDSGENLLFFVNLNKKISFQIDYRSTRIIIFSPFYHWTDNEIILSDYSNNFYMADLDSKKIQSIESMKIKEDLPDFYNFYNISRKFRVSKVYPHKFQFIYIDEDTKQVGLYDYFANDTVTISYDIDFHDVEYLDKKFIFISEEKIQVKDINSSSTFLKPLELHDFLRAKFISNKEFIVLMSNRSFTRGTLIKYQISD